ncbi:hypothetical protein [Dongia sp.]|uniref:hypothetical protein n=1 Tax=Dongia sp. TaxID=1977262 RepID=UPI00375171EC
MRLLVALAASALVSTAAMAGILDDTDKLKGQYIADVGELEPLRCMPGGKYDCMTWPSDLYRFNRTKCYQVSGYYGGYLNRKALLAVDKGQNVSIFVLPGTLESDVKQYRVVKYECPDLF